MPIVLGTNPEPLDDFRRISAEEAEDVVATRSPPPAGRPPMRSVLLGRVEFEDIPPVRDTSTER